MQVRAPLRFGKFVITHDDAAFSCAWRLGADSMLTVVVYNEQQFKCTTLADVAPYTELSVLARTAALSLLDPDEPIVRDRREPPRPPGFRDFAEPSPPRPAAALMARLRETEQHLVAGEKRIAQVRERLASFGKERHDTTQAKALLARLEDARSLYMGTCERLRRELGATGGSDSLRRA